MSRDRPTLDWILADAGARVSGACGFRALTQGVRAEPCEAFSLFPPMQIAVAASTTQMITGANVGVVALRRVSAARWGLAGAIMTAWNVALPAAGITATVFYSLGFWIK